MCKVLISALAGDILNVYLHLFLFSRNLWHLIFIQNVPFISIILKLSAPRDYQGFMVSWESTSGSYVIDPFVDRHQLVTVYYDMETENEGWTVQIVISFSLSFYLSLFLSTFIHPPSTIPFYPFFLSFFLFSSLTIFEFAIVLGFQFIIFGSFILIFLFIIIFFNL